jgi:hypothetical protein
MNVTSTNPIAQKIVSGEAPLAAQLMAARGLLPLAQADLLEVLVALRSSANAEVAEAARATLDAQASDELLKIAQQPDAPPSVLAFLATNQKAGRAVHEAVAQNQHTPYSAIAELARATNDGRLLELITVNQQRLIREPAIIEAVLQNPARTAEAERRASEVRREFFEKERGAQQIANEMRARGMDAAAEFVEQADATGEVDGALTVDDLWEIAAHIEASDAEIDDSWLPAEALALLESIESESYRETQEQRAANVERIIAEQRAEGIEVGQERISLIRRIMLMNVKDRVKLAMKGDRETRMILIRDSNRVVCVAVINNPRITDQEIEAISAMRTVSDEVLRIISMNRSWTRIYKVIHNLARNPRTPLPTAMTVLPRLQAKDLKALTNNRNVPEGVRRQALRLSQTRTGH